MTKAIVFDLDGVYFENGTETFIERLMTDYNLTYENISRVYLKSPEMREYKTGRITGDAFWAWAITEWRIKATKNEIVNLLINSYREKPETLDLVRKARERGIKTAVCTNNFPERLNGLENRFHFKTNFDAVVTSFEEGTLKPDPKIFEILANKLDLPPNSILMSDDKTSNVEALKQLGFVGVLYTGFAGFKQTLKEYGIRT